MASLLGTSLGQNRCLQAGGKILSPTILVTTVLAARGKVPLDARTTVFHHEGNKAQDRRSDRLCDFCLWSYSKLDWTRPVNTLICLALLLTQGLDQMTSGGLLQPDLFCDSRRDLWHPRDFTLHNLLKFHLQGLDGTSRVIARCAFNPVDGKTAIDHSCYIIIFKENHSVGMLNDSTIKAYTICHKTLFFTERWGLQPYL